MKLLVVTPEPVDAGALRADLPADLVSELIIGMYLQLARRMTRSATRPDFELWARTTDTLMVEGLAARTRQLLEARGWRRIEIGNAPATARRSALLYPARRRGEAERLANQFGFALQRRQGSNATLTLHLGSDAAAFLRSAAPAG